MSDPSTAAKRAIIGVGEGLLWGGLVGLVRGLYKFFRGADESWLQIPVLVLFGALVGAIICGAGRSIARRIPGALVGALAGLSIGVSVGYALFDFYWVVEEGRESDASSSATMVGVPLAQMISAAVGLVLGAVAGAYAERALRARAERARGDDTPGS